MTTLNTDEREILADLLGSLAINNKIGASEFIQGTLVGLYFCTSDMTEKDIEEYIQFVSKFLSNYVNEDEIQFNDLDFDDSFTRQVYIDTE